MVAGGRVVLRRAARMDHHDDDDDEEYVVDGDDDEEEEHDAEDGEPEEEDEDESDAEEPEEEGGEDLEIDAPRRPPRGRGRKARSDDDDSDADFDGAEEEEESEEDLAAETTRPRRRLPPKPRPRRQAPKRRPKREREPEPEEDSDADFEEELGIGAPRPRARRRPTKPRKLRDESDEDFDGEDEIETPRPKRAPSRARRRARRKATPQEDESDEDFDAEDDELFEIETPRPRRAPRAARKPRLQEDESDADFDGEEDDDGLGNRGFEIDAPWPKRAPTARSRRRRVEQQIVESDADFEGDEEEPEHDEVEVETPQPASSGSNVKQEDEFDADFDGEEQFDDREEDEELEVKTPQPAKFDADFNGADDEVDDQEADEELEIETPQSVKYDADFNEADEEVEDLEADQELEIETPQSVKYDADFNGTDEEVDDQEEDEELEIETLELRNPSKARGKGRKVKPAGSSRQRHEDDDDYEEEIEDEDEDFDPGVDEDEEDIEEDVEEDDDDLGEYAITHATKVRPRNHLPKRKPAAERQHRKRKSGSKGKTRNGMAARRRRRSEWVADDDEEEEDDEDFVVDDDVDEEVNRPRKKAKDGRKTRDGSAEPVAVGEAWPSLESDTSEFEFVTSEEEHAENEAPVAEPARIKRKKGRRKKGSESDSSSDSDYVISEEELKDLGVLRSQGTLLQLPPPPALRTIVPRRVDEKGKEPEEALKQICGICLSEEQRATIQGILNCCSHYFCFACILEWSKVESKCPLCKRRFNTITKSSVADLGLGLRNAPVRVEKRDQVYQPTEDEMRRWLDPYENVVCIECNQGGDDNLMLLCDICDSSAHTFCVGLGREVPEGNWYCGGCRSSAEGPSYAQTHERVVHHGESNVNTADSSSSSFGRSISSGVFQRPPPINIQPPLQGFDLNLSPIETPEEDKRAESHISAEPVSTPTGRHATLDRRRALNRRIRILLFRPRTATNAWQNSVQRDRSTQGTEQNQWNTSTSTDLSPSGSRADFMQSQQSSSQFVESASNLARCADEGGSNFREVENAKDQLIPIVKKSIKHICARSPLDQSSFTEVARRATHTILALSGIAHNRDRVVATPFPFPSHCCHACDGREPAFLMRTICSSCFNLFVGDVVSHIANMLS